MKFVKIHLEASSAHFRVPYTIFERKTYPIPPFSTVIGFICSLLGKEDKISKFLNARLSIAIVGDHEGVLDEYVWYRNLSYDEHVKRFGGTTRELNGEIEHPGGQVPVRIQTLVNPKVDIFLKLDDDIAEMVVQTLKDPEDRICLPHLGRAEDVLDKLDIEEISPSSGEVLDTNGYTWLVEPDKADLEGSKDVYSKIYTQMVSVVHEVPTLYRIVNGKRVFQSITAKIYKGALRSVEYEVPSLPYVWQGTPLFFAKIREKLGGLNEDTRKEQWFNFA